MSEDVKDMKDVELKDEHEAVTALDNARLEEVNRGYRILYLPEKDQIHKLFAVDSIRIYDKSVLAISRYGDQEFTKERNRLLKSGEYLTYKEQMRILKEKGDWSEDHESELEFLRDNVLNMLKQRDKLVSKLEAAEKSKSQNKDKKIEAAKMELQKLKEQMQDNHERLFDLAQIQIVYFRDTVEQRAQMRQQMGWVVSAVCKNEGDDTYDSDKRIWRDIDHLESTLSEKYFTSLIRECAEYWSVASSDQEAFFAESPDELKSAFAGEAQKN